MGTDDEFVAFVTARIDRWRRGAYLMCQDWHTADDVVSVAVTKLYRRWGRARKADNVDAYAQRVLTRACLDELRRSWRGRESPLPVPVEPDRAPSGRAAHDRVDDRAALASLLSALGPRQRAVVVLRFYLGYSVEETADLLGVSPGTVRSQSSRGLEAVRALASSTSRSEP